MSPIEIRLNPALVASLLETISPALEQLEGELASPAPTPDQDELMEDVWMGDLLESQREEMAIIVQLFDEDFMESGRAIILPEDMDRVLRACSAIRLKLRQTALAPLDDQELEEGELEDIQWTDALKVGYAAYSLFASLQELIVAQMDGGGSDPFAEDDDE